MANRAVDSRFMGLIKAMNVDDCFMYPVAFPKDYHRLLDVLHNLNYSSTKRFRTAQYENKLYIIRVA